MASPHSRWKRQRDKTQVRRALRGKDRRVQSSLEAARADEARLEERLAEEAVEAAAAQRAHDVRVRRETEERLALEAQAYAERVAREREAREAAEADAAHRRTQWTMGQARSLVRQGYSVEHAMRVTGWPREDLEDADRIFGE